jgi:hypothetical protein
MCYLASMKVNPQEQPRGLKRIVSRVISERENTILKMSTRIATKLLYYTQLVKEDTPLARKYKNQSVPEQNLVDLAWKHLMDSKYDGLREAICPTEAERQQLKQLVVNIALATEIMDKGLKQQRDARWEKALRASPEEKSDHRTSVPVKKRSRIIAQV